MDINVTAVFRKVPEGYVAFVEELPGAPADRFGPGGREGLLAGIEERVPGVLLASEPGGTTTLEISPVEAAGRPSVGPPEEDFEEEDVEHEGQ